jgi:trans-2,3-dihydro-3-hydroxyanthranilate isomerase
MELEFVTVDVFTRRRFGGNPLAVVFDPRAWLDGARMQAIAREFNLAETSFVRPARSSSHDAEVRIFTPAREMPWAGHPNVGTAWVLAVRAGLRQARSFRFEELAGVVSVAVEADGNGPIEARVQAPAALTRQAAPSADDSARCLGLDRSDLMLEGHGPVAVSVGFPFPMVELRHRDALLRARGQADAMTRALAPLDLGGVVAYCRETGPADAVDGQPVDLSARMFAPLMGVPEDPATGSAMAALGAWLARCDLEGQPEAQGSRTLRIAQGVDMGRPSLLETRVAVVDGQLGAASVGGACVAVSRGRITVA